MIINNTNNKDNITKSAKYKFEENILLLSNSTIFEEAVQEWEGIDDKKICLNPDKTIDVKNYELCICQRRVGNIYFYRNKRTQHTICVGTGCIRQLKRYLQKDCPTLSSKILRHVYTSQLEKGEYEIINSVVCYSNNIRNLIIEYLNNKIKNSTQVNDINELITLLDDLKNIKEYDLSNEIEIVQNKLNELEELNACKINEAPKLNIEINKPQDYSVRCINFNMFSGIPLEQIDRLFINKLQNIMYINKSISSYECEINPNTILCFRCDSHLINTSKIYSCIKCESIYNYWVNVCKQHIS